MATVRATMNLRFRPATDDELYRGKQEFPFAIVKMNENTLKFERYFVLEQQFRIEDIDGARFEWRSVGIADSEKSE